MSLFVTCISSRTQHLFVVIRRIIELNMIFNRDLDFKNYISSLKYKMFNAVLSVLASEKDVLSVLASEKCFKKCIKCFKKCIKCFGQ